MFEFEDTYLLEHQWKLSEKDVALSKFYDRCRDPARQPRKAFQLSLHGPWRSREDLEHRPAGTIGCET